LPEPYIIEQDWQKGLCDFTGPEAALPVGGYSKIPGWYPEKIAKSWTVEDPETDEGFAEKKTKELKADDIIIGVTLNPKTLAKIVDMYGRDFYQIREANGSALMTLDQWQTRFKSNGLGLVAIRNKRKDLNGGGVHF
jgi:hypothetical protein